VSLRGGPPQGVWPGSNVAGAVADGGQRLLAAVQEGRVVGALLAAVVTVRLPALALLLPAAAQDPDEGLQTHKEAVRKTVGQGGGGGSGVTCLNSRL